MTFPFPWSGDWRNERHGICVAAFPAAAGESVIGPDSFLYPPPVGEADAELLVDGAAAAVDLSVLLCAEAIELTNDLFGCYNLSNKTSNNCFNLKHADDRDVSAEGIESTRRLAVRPETPNRTYFSRFEAPH